MKTNEKCEFKKTLTNSSNKQQSNGNQLHGNFFFLWIFGINFLNSLISRITSLRWQRRTTFCEMLVWSGQFMYPSMHTLFAQDSRSYANLAIPLKPISDTHIKLGPNWISFNIILLTTIVNPTTQSTRGPPLLNSNMMTYTSPSSTIVTTEYIKSETKNFAALVSRVWIICCFTDLHTVTSTIVNLLLSNINIAIGIKKLTPAFVKSDFRNSFSYHKIKIHSSFAMPFGIHWIKESLDGFVRKCTLLI